MTGGWRVQSRCNLQPFEDCAEDSAAGSTRQACCKGPRQPSIKCRCYEYPLSQVFDGKNDGDALHSVPDEGINTGAPSISQTSIDRSPRNATMRRPKSHFFGRQELKTSATRTTRPRAENSSFPVAGLADWSYPWTRPQSCDDRG